MIAKPGYTVAFVREPKIKYFETQPGPVSMRITIEGGDMVQGVVKSVRMTDAEDTYYYTLTDGTEIMADCCLVTGFGDDTNIILEALMRYSAYLKAPETTSSDLNIAARADQIYGAIQYDRANSDRLRRIPVPFAANW
jgi:hypothetical protein